MAMVIRTAYSNRSWEAPCDYPGKDSLCWLCFKDILNISSPKRDDIICSSGCWEQHLRNDLRWGCTPHGRKFGSDAYSGEAVFFVFKQPDGSYTIWGQTTVTTTDIQPMKSSNPLENGYYFIHFNPFEPLPDDRRVRGLSDVHLVGARWLQGRYRYIDLSQEKYLDKLISGEATPVDSETAVPSGGPDRLSNVAYGNIFAQPIYDKLKKIASDEGRAIDELIREAVAMWLRSK